MVRKYFSGDMAVRGTTILASSRKKQTNKNAQTLVLSEKKINHKFPP